MNQALRKTATIHARPIKKWIGAFDPTPYPDQYATRVAGNCMEPDIKDGSVVLVDKTLTYKRGDLVVIYFKPEFVPAGQIGVLLKRLVLNVMQGITFPYKAHPESTVVPVLLVEQINPPRQFSIACDEVLAVHRCLGPVTADIELVELKKGGAK